MNSGYKLRPSYALASWGLVFNGLGGYHSNDWINIVNFLDSYAETEKNYCLRHHSAVYLRTERILKQERINKQKERVARRNQNIY